jgi:hypothetical protein
VVDADRLLELLEVTLRGLPVALTIMRMSNYGSSQGHSKPRDLQLSWFRVSLTRSVVAHSRDGEGYCEAIDLRHRPGRILVRSSRYRVSSEVNLARRPAAEEGRIRAVDLDIARHPMGQPGILFENIKVLPARFQRASPLPIPPHPEAVAIGQQVGELGEQNPFLPADEHRHTDGGQAGLSEENPLQEQPHHVGPAAINLAQTIQMSMQKAPQTLEAMR